MRSLILILLMVWTVAGPFWCMTSGETTLKKIFSKEKKERNRAALVISVMGGPSLYTMVVFQIIFDLF